MTFVEDEPYVDHILDHIDLSNVKPIKVGVNAGNGAAGHVIDTIETTIYAHAQDIAIFAAGPHVNRPSCSLRSDQWAFSLSTSTEKAMYALLLSAARARGKPVTVAGSDTCSA